MDEIHGMKLHSTPKLLHRWSLEMHYAKLSRAMRAPWVDRFLNNEIYCYPLSKKRCRPPLRSPPARRSERIVTSGRQQSWTMLVKEDPGVRFKAISDNMWTNKTHGFYFYTCLSYCIMGRLKQCMMFISWNRGLIQYKSRLIFTMRFLILVKWHLYTESGPCVFVPEQISCPSGHCSVTLTWTSRYCSISARLYWRFTSCFWLASSRLRTQLAVRSSPACCTTCSWRRFAGCLWRRSDSS